MADNDRFKIVKVESSCIKCCYFISNKCTNDLEICPFERKLEGKNRVEYEDIILQTINKELDKVLKNGEKINNIGLAKAVVDRLFGEGEWKK